MRDYVPISHTFPAQKPLMDENGKRKAVRPIDDLRVHTLKSQQQQQQQQQPVAKRPCNEGLSGPARAAAASGDSQLGGVFHQRSVDSAEVQPTGTSEQATDFSAFNALVRSERQQQQQPPGAAPTAGGDNWIPAAGGGVSFSVRPPQAPKAQFQVTTFDSLTSNVLPTDMVDHTAQLEGIRSLYKLGGDTSRDGGSLPGWPLPRAGSLGAAAATGGDSRGPTVTAAAAAAAGQQQQQPFELEGLPTAPWDWSLKTRVRVSAPRPLACLRASAFAGLLPACRAAARGCSAAAATAAMPAASAGLAGLAMHGVMEAALAERLQAALLQWQHPERQLTADALEVMRSAKSTAELLAARAGAWRDALRALMAALRNGQVPAAYVAGAQLFHQPMTVLFLAPGCIAGPDSSPAPAAIVSRSNRQLRQALDAVGGSYSMAVAGTTGEASKQQQGVGGSNNGSTAAAPSAADGRAGSQLLVRGARGVQALYLLLLQQPFCTGEGAGDVPVLLAPAAFAGAALCPCTFTELPGTAAVAPGSGAPQRRPPGATAAATGARHYAEIGPPPASTYNSSSSSSGSSSGLLVAPWTVARLAAVLAASEREFEVFTDCETTSSSLNLAATLGAPWEAAAAGVVGAQSTDGAADANVDVSGLDYTEEGGCGLTAAERAGWGVSARRLAGRMVRQLRFAAGSFAVRLAAP